MLDSSETNTSAMVKRKAETENKNHRGNTMEIMLPRLLYSPLLYLTKSWKEVEK